jgi:hypothetical protein
VPVCAQSAARIYLLPLDRAGVLPRGLVTAPIADSSNFGARELRLDFPNLRQTVTDSLGNVQTSAERFYRGVMRIVGASSVQLDTLEAFRSRQGARLLRDTVGWRDTGLDQPLGEGTPEA